MQAIIEEAAEAMLGRADGEPDPIHAIDARWRTPALGPIAA